MNDDLTSFQDKTHLFFSTHMKYTHPLVIAAGALLLFGGLYLVTRTNAPSSQVFADPSANEIRVGFVGPLTGNAAAFGLPIQKSVMLAEEEINRNGGIHGKRIKVIYEDGKCDPKEAVTAIQKLINVDHIVMSIVSCSGEVLAVAPIVNEKHIPIISPIASVPDITTKGGEYTFRLYPSDALAGKVAAQYATEDLHAKKVAVISENTDYAQGLRGAFTTSFKSAGGEVAFDEVFNSGTIDFRTLALKIKDAQVDAIYVVPQTPTSGIIVVKALKDQGLTQPLLTGEALIGDAIVKDNKGVLEGIRSFDVYFDEQSAGRKHLVEAFRQKFQEELAFPSLMMDGYTSLYLVKEMLEKQGEDGQKIQQGLATLTHWKGGALDDVTFDQYGDIKWDAYALKEARNGKAETLKVFQVK